MDIDYLEQAIGAMLMAKVITFEANSWAFGFVDMVVKYPDGERHRPSHFHVWP